MKYEIIKAHISQIRPGDTVLQNEELKTVGKKDIKKDSLLGVTLFGDSYHAGHKPVLKAEIFHARPIDKKSMVG